MITLIPALGILIDIPLGILMWSTVMQFVLTIFIRENSSLAFAKIVRGLNQPIIALTALIRPYFIAGLLNPLYATFILFILRYYLFPLVIGFDVENFWQMPLEKLLFSAKSDLGL